MSWWLSALIACVAFLAGAAAAGWRARRKRGAASVARKEAGSPASPFAAFERLTDPILLLDERGNIGRVSSAAVKLFGQASVQPGRPFTALLHEDDVAAARDALECVVSGVEADDAPLWRFWTDGSWQSWHVQLSSFLDDPAVRAVAMVLRPQLPVARSFDPLGVPPLRDAISGLGNRVLFRDRLQHALLRTRRRGGSVAVVLVDLLDLRFAGVKPSHEELEALLAQAGKRIATFVRGEDSAARLEGTRFALVLEHLEGERGFVQVARRLGELFEEPLGLDGRRYMCRVAVGVAVANPGEDPDDVLRNAAAAARAAARRGVSYVEVYDVALHGPALAYDRLELELRRALEGEQFHLVYQPVVALRSRRIVAVEAFLRWHHPERGPVPAAAFVPVAEETRLVVPIGRWVLKEVARQLCEWHEQLGPGTTITVMVNVSPRHFLSRSFPDDLEGVLAAARSAAGNLVLELPEAAVVRWLPDIQRRMLAIRQLGARIALDDYTGRHGALADVSRFPVDYLKVDSSLVAQLTLRPQEHAAVRAIVALGRLARVRAIAEGLEREDQLAALLRLRCDYGQGTLFAEPMPAAEIFKLLGRG